MQALSNFLGLEVVLVWRNKEGLVDETLSVHPVSGTRSTTLPRRVLLRYHPYHEMYGDRERAMHVSPGIEVGELYPWQKHETVPLSEYPRKEEILGSFSAGGRRKRKYHKGKTGMFLVVFVQFALSTPSHTH